MIEGIFFYYLWILISLLGFYILLRCAYEDKEYTKKVKFPMIAYVGAFIFSITPILNIATGIVVWVDLILTEGEDSYYKHFLFKKF